MSSGEWGGEEEERREACGGRRWARRVNMTDKKKRGYRVWCGFVFVPEGTGFNLRHPLWRKCLPFLEAPRWVWLIVSSLHPLLRSRVHSQLWFHTTSSAHCTCCARHNRRLDSTLRSLLIVLAVQDIIGGWTYLQRRPNIRPHGRRLLVASH